MLQPSRTAQFEDDSIIRLFTRVNASSALSFLAAAKFNGLPVDPRSAANLTYFTSQLKVFIGYPMKEGC